MNRVLVFYKSDLQETVVFIALGADKIKDSRVVLFRGREKKILVDKKEKPFVFGFDHRLFTYVPERFRVLFYFRAEFFADPFFIVQGIVNRDLADPNFPRDSFQRNLLNFIFHFFLLFPALV
jgi:hypothetical protein